MGKIIRLLLVFVSIGWFLSLAGCDLLGTDNNTDNVDHSARDPLIPYATSLSEGLPSRTASKVVATIPASELGTFDITLTAKPPQNLFLDGDYNAISWPDGTQTTLVCGVDDNDTAYALFPTGTSSSKYTLKNPIVLHPVYLQISYYYTLINQFQITQNSSKTVEESWTCGVDIEKAQSFTSTLGYSATLTAGVEWKGVFSAEASATVSQELSSTYTSTTTISKSDTYSESETFEPTGDGTYLYGVWQRVEVFQFVDADGKPWDVSDLGYEFAEDPDNNGGIFGFESKLPKNVYEIVTYDVFH